MKRMTFEESCRELQKLQLLDADEIPTLLQRPPRHDDEELGGQFLPHLTGGRQIGEIDFALDVFW